MDPMQHEQYEYARRRIRQKKNVFLHFLLFLVGSLFLLLAEKVMNIGEPENWCIWAIIGWGFIFVMHFLKVFVTDSFMNKNWEQHQIEKLIALQQKKIRKLQAELDMEKEIAE